MLKLREMWNKEMWNKEIFFLSVHPPDNWNQSKTAVPAVSHLSSLPDTHL